MNNTAKLKAIDALLSAVPAFDCKPGCSDCCGPVAFSRLEIRRIEQRTGISRKQLHTSTLLKKGCLTCPLLDQEKHRCSAYEIRPAMCKVFGSSLHHWLVCPHGCAPEHPLSVESTNQLVDQAIRLGGGFADPLENWADKLLNRMGETAFLKTNRAE